MLTTHITILPVLERFIFRSSLLCQQSPLSLGHVGLPKCIGIEPIHPFGWLPVSNRTHYLSVNTANGVFIQNPITDIHLKVGWINAPTIRIFTSFLTETVLRCCASRYCRCRFHVEYNPKLTVALHRLLRFF